MHPQFGVHANLFHAARIGGFPSPRREPPTGPRFAPAKSKPGGIVEQSSGATAPHRVSNEVTLLRAIPASWWHSNLGCAQPFPVGTIGSREYLSELLLLAKQARIELAASPVFTGALSQSNAHLHHTGISCGGNNWLKIALPLSYGSFATGRTRTCDRCNSRLHHAANS